MKISLKSLILRNFKGIKDLSINFQKLTDIRGENATGKTTVADGFMWLLFDKDSQDRKDFEIKTLDSNNEVIHGLEHEVTGVLNVNGKNLTLTKIYKEKWTKKRGEAERELTGHETLYYIDEVPVKKSEYQDNINNIIDEQLFKLISNPLYFSTMMKWQDRRNVILEIIGDIPVDRILNYRKDLGALEVLLTDKDVDTLKKSLAARKKKLNDDIRSIPYRIDELNNSIKELDFEALEIQKYRVVADIKNIEDKMLDSSKANEELLAEKNVLYELKSKLRNIEYRLKDDAQKPLQELKNKLHSLKDQAFTCNQNICSFESGIAYDEKSINELETELEQLRNLFTEINQETLEIPEESFVCPTCKRELEAHDIESKLQEMHGNFNQNKAKRLSDVNTKGKSKKERLLKLKKDLDQATEHLKDEIRILASYDDEIKELALTVSGNNFSLNLESNQEYQDTLNQIKELEIKLQQPVGTTNQTTELRFKKRELEHELEDINRDLTRKEQNKEIKVRITTLLDEEKKLAQQIAELEGHEYLCEQFIKTKVELLESGINSKFRFVNFKLFNTLVNGAVEECCEALINGVPFNNANTASQINAGLDIINALSEYYNVSAPIFIDNRESVNEILECNSQIINLIVSKDKTLTIINLESEVA